MLKRSAPCLVALALLSGACGGKTAAEVNREESAAPLDLVVQTKGAVNIAFHQQVPSRFIVRHMKGKDLDASVQIMGAQMAAPTPYGSAKFAAGFAVVGYQGDGTYTIPAGSPIEEFKRAQQAGARPAATSSIKLDWWPTGQADGAPWDFIWRVKPCTVVVKDAGTHGSVVCPDVTDELRQKHFSMTMRWTAPPKATGGASSPAP
jgi:hypothetical protein